MGEEASLGALDSRALFQEHQRQRPRPGLPWGSCFISQAQNLSKFPVDHRRQGQELLLPKLSLGNACFPFSLKNLVCLYMMKVKALIVDILEDAKEDQRKRHSGVTPGGQQLLVLRLLLKWGLASHMSAVRCWEVLLLPVASHGHEHLCS